MAAATIRLSMYPTSLLLRKGDRIPVALAGADASLFEGGRPGATFSLVASGQVIGSGEGPRPINEGVSPLPQTGDLATFLVLLASYPRSKVTPRGVCRDQSD